MQTQPYIFLTGFFIIYFGLWRAVQHSWGLDFWIICAYHVVLHKSIDNTLAMTWVKKGY